jgi:hypothetical protein
VRLLRKLARDVIARNEAISIVNMRLLRKLAVTKQRTLNAVAQFTRDVIANKGKQSPL